MSCCHIQGLDEQTTDGEVFIEQSMLPLYFNFLLLYVYECLSACMYVYHVCT